MRLKTERFLGLAAWLGFFLFVAITAPSTDKAHLVETMLAWSLVGLAFGVSWLDARDWVERKVPPVDAASLRRFKLAQMGVWIGTILVFVWVSQIAGAADEAGVMGVVTLFIAPIWFGIRRMLAPRSTQLTG
jgi:hypothetical protein